VLEAELLLQRSTKKQSGLSKCFSAIKDAKQLIMSSLDSYLNLLNKTNTTNQVEQRCKFKANSIPTKIKNFRQSTEQ
jgi:hypothetical protein